MSVEIINTTANYDDGVLGERIFGGGQDGILLRLNEAGDTWDQVAPAPALGSSSQEISALCVYDNGDGDKLYGLISWQDGSGDDCITLVKWNGTNAWVAVATLAAGTPAGHSYYGQEMIEYSVPANGGPALFMCGGHYDGENSAPAIFAWDGDATLSVVSENSEWVGNLYALVAMGSGLDSYLYAAGSDGMLFRLNYNDWTLAEVAPVFGDLLMLSLCVHDGSMFCAGYSFGSGGALWRWSEIVAEIDEVPFEAGDGYAVDDVLVLPSGSGDATVKVTSISGGGSTGPVTGLELTSGGTGGYTISEGNATTTEGAGIGCTVTIFTLLWEKVADQFEDEEEIDRLIDLDGELLGSTYPRGLLLRWNEADAWEQVAGQFGSTEWLSKFSVMGGVLYCGANTDSGVGGQLLKWIPPTVGVPEWLPEQPGSFEIDVSAIDDLGYAPGSIIRTDATIFENDLGVFAALKLTYYENGEVVPGYIMALSDDVTRMFCVALALEVGTGTKRILLKGIVRNDAWDWNPGDPVYVETSDGGEGKLTQIEPGAGCCIQIVGYALEWNVLDFNPNLAYAEV